MFRKYLKSVYICQNINMVQEKIIKRPDGSSVKILVSLSVDFFGCYWNCTVYAKEKNKKLWGYGEAKNDKTLATLEEVEEVKNELMKTILSKFKY